MEEKESLSENREVYCSESEIVKNTATFHQNFDELSEKNVNVQTSYLVIKDEQSIESQFGDERTTNVEPEENVVRGSDDLVSNRNIIESAETSLDRSVFFSENNSTSKESLDDGDISSTLDDTTASLSFLRLSLISVEEQENTHKKEDSSSESISHLSRSVDQKAKKTATTTKSCPDTSDLSSASSIDVIYASGDCKTIVDDDICFSPSLSSELGNAKQANTSVDLMSILGDASFDVSTSSSFDVTSLHQNISDLSEGEIRMNMKEKKPMNNISLISNGEFRIEMLDKLKEQVSLVNPATDKSSFSVSDASIISGVEINDVCINKGKEKLFSGTALSVPPHESPHSGPTTRNPAEGKNLLPAVYVKVDNTTQRIDDLYTPVRSFAPPKNWFDHDEDEPADVIEFIESVGDFYVIDFEPRKSAYACCRSWLRKKIRKFGCFA